MQTDIVIEKCKGKKSGVIKIVVSVPRTLCDDETGIGNPLRNPTSMPLFAELLLSECQILPQIQILELCFLSNGICTWGFW